MSRYRITLTVSTSAALVGEITEAELEIFVKSAIEEAEWLHVSTIDAAEIREEPS